MGISFSRKGGPTRQVSPAREVPPCMMLDDVLELNERPLLCAVEQLTGAMRSGNPGEPRTIFCHDMDGNYKEDRLCNICWIRRKCFQAVCLVKQEYQRRPPDGAGLSRHRCFKRGPHLPSTILGTSGNSASARLTQSFCLHRYTTSNAEADLVDAAGYIVAEVR
ncbi:hypothetical protein HPB50_017554 [Hyalomma asiaticum]|uniref:Uncharacterized protein n=1 Tax=Hyalomma asiaticum TaxID=266040 RepID=A0ACB7TJG9_HYAAI|nr:hypothetical protein HPB50_017554 [Hyalomma asiaticum]